MPRKGKVDRGSMDRATTVPEVRSSKMAARERDLPGPDLSQDFKVGKIESGGRLDPLAAVLADGSDVPSQRVLLPTREQVARRAYEIYLRRAGAPGSPEEDWYQAERELAEELRAEQPRPAATGRRPAARSARKVTPAAEVDGLRADEAEG